MKRIRVVITGGTIGSKKDETGVIRVEKDLDYSEYFPEDLKGLVEITVTSPCFVLSENMNFRIWETIMDSVEQILAEEKRRSEDMENDFAGILILHGSDTLSYTTALFGHLYEKRLEAFGARMVLTGANKPLSDPDSNGRENLKLAWSYLLAGAVEAEQEPKVTSGSEADSCAKTTVFEGKNHMRVCAAFDGKLMDADRIMEADPYTDRFSEKPLVISEEEWAAERERSLSEEQENGVPGIRRFLRKAQLLKAYPGFDYSMIDLDGPACPKAFVHVLGGTGTVYKEVQGEADPKLLRQREAGGAFFQIRNHGPVYGFGGLSDGYDTGVGLCNGPVPAERTRRA